MPQAYTLTGPCQFELRECELPDLGPHDVCLQSMISGISHGTELNLYRGRAPFASKHFDEAHRLESDRFWPVECRWHDHPALPVRPNAAGFSVNRRVPGAGDLSSTDLSRRLGHYYRFCILSRGHLQRGWQLFEANLPGN